ncbi:MAG: replicative DNA helicase [Oscillospiraceae bacterium]|jgi:replicative DNA helicase|nr:replicative DNA helicase [Oscillospiraceae bacterium]
MSDYRNIALTEYAGQDLSGQPLPYNLEAEQSVLGAVLVDSGCMSVVMDHVRPESFFRQENARIFEIMVRLFAAGLPIDHVTVLENVLVEHVFQSDADARVYLANLIQILPSTANVEAYAAIVREKHYVRSLIMTAREIIENSQGGAADAQLLLDSAEQKIYDIRQGRETTTLHRIDSILVDIYDKLQRLSSDDREQYAGLPTGFAGLDRVITGLNRSDLILVAARPGMGKSAFALNVAVNVTRKTGKKAVFFSLEMSKEQLVERILSSEALVRGDRMRTGELGTEDWIRIAESARDLAQIPLYFDDTAGITVPEIKARLRRVKDLGVVIIDYLQLMSSTSRSENRVAVVSEITRSLKIMAKDLNVPVIVCSQLSRGPESRTDHRPMLSDLRESGSIEQDADIVMFLYRDAYYNRESEEQNVAECIVSKNRHGETGIVKMAWDGDHTKFSGLEIFRDER